MVAYGIEDSTPHNGRHQLFSEQRQKNTTDDGQNQIVHHEEAVELEWLPTFHELSSRKHRHVIGYEQCHCRRESRERRSTWNEDKLVCRVSYDTCIELVELRP